jgi:hypothetical protein
MPEDASGERGFIRVDADAPIIAKRIGHNLSHVIHILVDSRGHRPRGLADNVLGVVLLKRWASGP